MRLQNLCVVAIVLCLCVPTSDAAAYDYSEPMRCISLLPLGYPESPFVLRFSSEELQAQPLWSNRIDAIVISQEAAPPIRAGAEALHATLKRLGLGEAALVQVDAARRKLPATLRGDRVIVLGVPDQFALAATLSEKANLEVTDESLNGDGFIIRPIRQGRRELLLIASPVARGVLYGAYELEERTGKHGVPSIDQRFVPSVRYRSWPFHAFTDEPPDAIGRWRLNISMVWFEFYHSILLYSDFPELCGEKHKEEILKQQEILHEKFANAARYGALAAVHWNPLCFSFAPPIGSHRTFQEAIAKAHPGILAQPLTNTMGNLCPSHPSTRHYVESAVKELVETFPEIDLIVFQFSDVGGELTCGCDRCRNYPFLNRIADYSELVIDTARQLKPPIRFMMFPSGLMSLVGIHHPELGDDMVAGLKRLKEVVGKDVETFFLTMGNPPGLDSQSWLAPDSSMLDQGIPLFFDFQHCEADGPGIISPISQIVGHLSWSLPIHLDTLKRYVSKGMIGAMSQVAGVEVGFWHHDLEPQSYMRNWCRAKYGQVAGEYVYQALVDTHKITEAFHLDTRPDAIESIDFYRWGDYHKPWATDMSPLKNAGLTEWSVAIVMAAIVSGFKIPKAPQPEGLKRVTLSDQGPWLKRFELAKEIAIADRSERMLANALAGEREIPRSNTSTKLPRPHKLLLDSSGNIIWRW